MTTLHYMAALIVADINEVNEQSMLLARTVNASLIWQSPFCGHT